MTVQEVLSRCRELGVILAPGPQGKLRVSPPGVLSEELREELKRRKAEVLALLRLWPCERCGEPAELEAVEPRNDAGVWLTYWHCLPCQTWAVTPSTVREPPVWVSSTKQRGVFRHLGSFWKTLPPQVRVLQRAPKVDLRFFVAALKLRGSNAG